MVTPTYCLLPNWPLFRKPKCQKINESRRWRFGIPRRWRFGIPLLRSLGLTLPPSLVHSEIAHHREPGLGFGLKLE